jgi:tetrapyrrole methylase family protein/MazG family protein
MNAYPDDHLVTLIHAAGAPQQRTTRVALHELDHRDDFDHLTTLYVPPLEQGGSFSDLLEIVAHLRAPEGCLWDQEQTLESLRQDLLGECVEVLEAIDAEADGADNSLHIAEELGDLFMVAAMMGQIAGEEGRFKLADVTRSIVAKLIRRHPHVFGETVVENVQEVLQNWEAIKAAEKAEKGQSMVSPLEGAPAGLPALEKARKLQSKAAKAGLLDRAQLAATVAAALARFDAQPDEASLGELLWQLVAQAGRHGLNAEDALRAYTVRFRQKYINLWC